MLEFSIFDPALGLTFHVYNLQVDDSYENSSLILYKIQDGHHKVCTTGVIDILRTKVSSNKLVEGKLKPATFYNLQQISFWRGLYKANLLIIPTHIICILEP